MSYIEIAQIMGTHGVRGDLRIRPYNDDTSVFKKGNLIFLKQGNKYNQFEITSASPLNKGLKVHLSGIDDKDNAHRLYKAGVFVTRESLPKLDEDEFYLSDMVGMEMLDHVNGRNYGTITDIMETGANDCYVVENEEFEMLVPVIEGVIKEIDSEKKQVTVVLPEGLVDIYES